MKRQRPYPGFTLIEILIVVVILGILAAIVIPQFAIATDESRYNAFTTDLKTMTSGVLHYSAVHGYPEDGSSGVLRAELEPYIDKGEYESPTPIGGVWDIEHAESGITSAVGVHFVDSDGPGDAVMQHIDSLIDDGDLSTGGFRKLATDRYYAIIDPTPPS